MTGWRLFGCLLMLALVSLVGSRHAAFAQDDKEGKLEFKAFAPGAAPFYQELETDTEQNMKVMGQEVTQKQKQTFYISWTPKTEKDAKDLTVVEKIVGVKMKIDIGGNKIEYDSTEEKAANNPMADFFNALKTLDLTLVIDPSKMTVKEVKGRDDFVKKLSDTNPQMQPLLKNILSDEAIKQMAQPTWGAVPREAVKKGSTWKDTSKLNLGAIGTYETTFDYTYAGQEKGLDKIDVKTTLKYIAPSGTADKGSLPFTIKEASNLTSKEGTGVVYFDRAKGRIDNSEMKMKLEGSLVIEVGGMTTTVELVQNQTSRMKTSDTNPLEKTPEKKK